MTRSILSPAVRRNVALAVVTALWAAARLLSKSWTWAGVRSDGLVFLRTTGFKQGQYVEISYQDIERAISDAESVITWLVDEIPESDGVGVEMQDEVFDLLADQAHPSD